MPATTTQSKVRSIEELDLAWMQWWSSPHPQLSKLPGLVARSGLSYVGVDGCGPLVWVLRQNPGRASRFVEALLAAGFDASEPQGALCPLFEACYRRDMKSLRMLLSSGANPNGRTPALAQACVNESDFRFVEELIKAGASIAPGIGFDGVVSASARDVDDFHTFNPARRWNRLAQLIAEHATDQWGEFTVQMRQWADRVGEPAFVDAVSAWLCDKEAKSVLERTTPVASGPSVPRPRV